MTLTKKFAFVFDFNGVLFWDTHFHDSAWRQYSKELRGHELTDDEMLHEVHGKTNKDVLEYLAGQPLSDEEIKRRTDEKEGIYRQLCLDNPQEFKLAPGAVELLDYLKAHDWPRTIATSSELGNVQFFYQHLNLAEWFDFDLVAYDDGTLKGKPEPDIYLRAFEKLGLKGADCLVIEDSRSGIKSAHRAGAGMIIAIGRPEQQQSLSEIEGVDKTIIDFYQLLSEIK
jgi:HAD superfamily hydrolase (TIGR01509 family)